MLIMSFHKIFVFDTRSKQDENKSLKILKYFFHNETICYETNLISSIYSNLFIHHISLILKIHFCVIAEVNYLLGL